MKALIFLSIVCLLTTTGFGQEKQQLSKNKLPSGQGHFGKDTKRNVPGQKKVHTGPRQTIFTRLFPKNKEDKSPDHFRTASRKKGGELSDGFASVSKKKEPALLASSFEKKQPKASKKPEEDRYNEEGGFGGSKKKGQKPVWREKQFMGKDAAKRQEKKKKKQKGDAFANKNKRDKRDRKRQGPEMGLFQGKVLPKGIRKGDKRSEAKADRAERQLKKAQEK